MQTTPTHSTTFDAKIRDAWVYVEASAWADHEGIYKTAINGVFIDGVDVMGLLNNADICELDGMVECAIAQDQFDDIGE